MIDGNTPVTLTMKQLLVTVGAGVGLLCAGLWAVLTVTTGGLRDDVSVIRQAAQTLQVSDKETALRLRESENKLADQIAGLRTDLVAFSGRFDATNANVVALTRRMDDFQKQLASRQAALNDPSALSAFADKIKGFTASKDASVVIVPFTADFQQGPVPMQMPK